MKKELRYLILVVVIVVVAGAVVYFYKFAPEDEEVAVAPTSEDTTTADTNDSDLPVVDGSTAGTDVPGGDLQGNPQAAEPAEQQPPQPLRSFDTEEGVKVEIFQEGEGDEAVAGKTVVVHYAGILTDGTLFDTSLERDPFAFVLGSGQVIPGWDIGVAGMKIGEIRRLTIPSELGYGARGAGGAIPPNADLIFDVELLAT